MFSTGSNNQCLNLNNKEQLAAIVAVSCASAQCTPHNIKRMPQMYLDKSIVISAIFTLLFSDIVFTLKIICNTDQQQLKTIIHDVYILKERY